MIYGEYKKYVLSVIKIIVMINNEQTDGSKFIKSIFLHIEERVFDGNHSFFHHTHLALAPLLC